MSILPEAQLPASATATGVILQTAEQTEEVSPQDNLDYICHLGYLFLSALGSFSSQKGLTTGLPTTGTIVTVRLFLHLEITERLNLRPFSLSLSNQFSSWV